MIRDEDAAILESGCALIVGTVGADGRPRAVRGWGIRLLADRQRARLLVAADPRVVDNLRATGAVAVTATVVATFESVQLKGSVTSVEDATSADLQFHVRFHTEFFQAVHRADGADLDVLPNLLPSQLVAVEFAVAEVYDQTPGPKAGTQLAPMPGAP